MAWAHCPLQLSHQPLADRSFETSREWTLGVEKGAETERARSRARALRMGPSGSSGSRGNSTCTSPGGGSKRGAEALKILGTRWGVGLAAADEVCVPQRKLEPGTDVAWAACQGLARTGR